MTLYTSKDDGSPYGQLSFPDYESVLEAVPALQSAAAVGLDGMMLGEREAGELLLVETVTGNYFDVLGVQPVLGRAGDAARRLRVPLEQVFEYQGGGAQE